MDYSLLLGLDNQRNELVVGLVDAIGSFNLFKTIESRGKLALTRGGEVTIVSGPHALLELKNSVDADDRSRRTSIESASRMPYASTLWCVTTRSECSRLHD
jgi:1-phosphatidylinositol-3-phosphate 5-kinase